jgi:primosomal protein N' (replication factor Y)
MAPDAPSIVHASHHDADGFLRGELGRREALRYPPFSTLVRIVCSSVEAGEAHAAAAAVRERLGAGPPALLGPAPLFRLRGRERSVLLLKADPRDRQIAVAEVGAAVDATAADKRHRAAAFSVDVDPQ